MELKDFLQLAGQQGKVVVIGEDGNVKGMFLSFDEFQKLSGQDPSAAKAPPQDLTEKANREILQAQLEEVISSTNGGLGAAMPEPEEIEAQIIEPLERIDSVLSKRAQELFKSIPVDPMPMDYPYRDYTTPHVSHNSDEEIKPNFDDI